MKGIFERLSFKRRSTAEERKIQQAYKKVFASPEGEIILVDLMRESKMFSNNYNQEISLETVEGKRTMVYYIVHILYNDVDKITENEYNNCVVKELTDFLK